MQKLKDENVEIGVILNDEDVKQVLTDIHQLEDNKIELIVSGADDVFNDLEINDVQDIEEAISSGLLGDEILTEYNILGEEAADEYVLGIATTISEADLPNVHIDIDDLEFSDNLHTQAQTFAET